LSDEEAEREKREWGEREERMGTAGQFLVFACVYAFVVSICVSGRYESDIAMRVDE